VDPVNLVHAVLCETASPLALQAVSELNAQLAVGSVEATDVIRCAGGIAALFAAGVPGGDVDAAVALLRTCTPVEQLVLACDLHDATVAEAALRLLSSLEPDDALAPCVHVAALIVEHHEHLSGDARLTACRWLAPDALAGVVTGGLLAPGEGAQLAGMMLDDGCVTVTDAQQFAGHLRRCYETWSARWWTNRHVTNSVAGADGAWPDALVELAEVYVASAPCHWWVSEETWLEVTRDGQHGPFAAAAALTLSHETETVRSCVAALADDADHTLDELVRAARTVLNGGHRWHIEQHG
jgi:hypothetical protein